MHVTEFYQGIAPTPTQYLTTINNKHLWIKRDDLNDQSIQGNKLRKLKATLLQASHNQQSLISFGGAYSNHIAALAAAGKRFDIATTGIIRGEELRDSSRWNPTLRQAAHNGMQLIFINRSEYRDKEQGASAQNLLQKQPNSLIIPEGGSCPLALSGCQEIVDEIIADTTTPVPKRLFLACGTGGTMAGVIQGAYQHQLTTHITGVPVLKGGAFISDTIAELAEDAHKMSWDLILDAHCGGYAKTSAELEHFITYFESTFTIALDPIYTAKLCKAVFARAQQSSPQKDEHWLIYHSGGLQGRKDITYIS